MRPRSLSPLTETVLIRMTPEQRVAFNALGGAVWVRAMIEAMGKSIQAVRHEALHDVVIVAEEAINHARGVDVQAHVRKAIGDLMEVKE